jgi:hypothetical protein
VIMGRIRRLALIRKAAAVGVVMLVGEESAENLWAMVEVVEVTGLEVGEADEAAAASFSALIAA